MMNLKDFLSRSELTRKEKVLLILSTQAACPKLPSEVKRIASEAGLRAIKSWNIASILSTTPYLAVRTPQGWELNTEGKKRVRAIMGVPSSPSFEAAVDLRAHLKSIKNPNILAFVGEAIGCLETGFLRPAVVFSWIGAVAIIYDYIVAHELSIFNSEAKRRNQKWREAKTTDDLARLKEHELLEILESLSIIGKNVKQELQNCLKLRNACGHPSSLKIGVNRVASHIEVLVLNVFEKF